MGLKSDRLPNKIILFISCAIYCNMVFFSSLLIITPLDLMRISLVLVEPGSDRSAPADHISAHHRLQLIPEEQGSNLWQQRMCQQEDSLSELRTPEDNRRSKGCQWSCASWSRKLDLVAGHHCTTCQAFTLLLLRSCNQHCEADPTLAGSGTPCLATAGTLFWNMMAYGYLREILFKMFLFNSDNNVTIATFYYRF